MEEWIAVRSTWSGLSGLGQAAECDDRGSGETQRDEPADQGEEGEAELLPMGRNL